MEIGLPIPELHFASYGVPVGWQRYRVVQQVCGCLIGLSDMSDDNTMNNINDSLRLRAQDADDLTVLSSLFQDAIIPGSDMHIDKANKRFVLVANRFCWERPPGGYRPQPTPGSRSTAARAKPMSTKITRHRSAFA